MDLALNLISFSYPSNFGVLGPLEFSLASGQSLAVVGGGGSGKSTMITLLAGLHPEPLGGRWEGSLLWGGEPSPPDLPYRVGYLGASPEVFLTGFCPTVLEEVGWTLLRSGWPSSTVEQRVGETLESLKLESLARRNPLSLSTGQQQMVALAAVWARQPEILLLDEPVAYLDPVARVRLTELVNELRESHQTTVVWATSQLEQVCDFDYYLHLGDDRCEPYSAGWTPQETLCLKPVAARLAESLGRRDIFWYWPEGAALPGVRTSSSSSAPSANLEVQGLRYRPVAQSKDLFQGFDLSLLEGETVALVGPNGAGKSTLGKLLRGLLPVAEGTIRLNSMALEDLGAAARTGLVGYSFQDARHLLCEPSVQSEFLYSGELLGLEEAEARERTSVGLELFGLEATHHPRELCARDQSLLGVALSWFTMAPVQVLDEPMAHLDGAGIGVLERVLSHWSSAGVTVLVIGHELDWLLQRCDRVLVLSEGRLVRDECPGQLLEDWPLELLGEPLVYKGRQR